MPTGFREIVDPNLGRADPVQWERRHHYSVQSLAPEVYRISMWDASASALRTCSLRLESLSPYFQARARVDQILTDLAGPFDTRVSLAAERARMQAAIADRIYVAYKYARGETHVASATPARAADDLADFLAGIQLIVRHDLLSMFAHPRLFHAPSLESAETDDDSPIAAPLPLSPREMTEVYGSFRKAIGPETSDASPLAFAEHRGADFMSADNGRTWLRLRLDGRSNDRAHALTFLRSVVDCASRLDALVLDVSRTGQHEIEHDMVHDDAQDDLFASRDESYTHRASMQPR